MRRIAHIFAVCAVGALTLAPVLADARPGGNSSSGSRGERTFSPPASTNTAPNAARPMDRTMSEPGRAGTQTAPGSSQAAQGARPAAAPGGFFQRNPFMGGLMAGVLGAGLLGMMGGAGFFSGLGSLAGMLGFLLQIALIGGIVMLVIAFIRRRRQQPQLAGMPREMQTDQPRAVMGLGGGQSAAQPAVTITPADQTAFGAALVSVNAAWSAGDTAALSRLATPEMIQFFRDDFDALKARGWKNETSDLRLESADVSEAWNEDARDYCTVAMRFSLIDVTRSLSDGAVVEGSPTNRQTATEIWTFVRVQSGPWQLSAIQQTS